LKLLITLIFSMILPFAVGVACNPPEANGRRSTHTSSEQRENDPLRSPTVPNLAGTEPDRREILGPTPQLGQGYDSRTGEYRAQCHEFRAPRSGAVKKVARYRFSATSLGENQLQLTASVTIINHQESSPRLQLRAPFDSLDDRQRALLCGDLRVSRIESGARLSLARNFLLPSGALEGLLARLPNDLEVGDSADDRAYLEQAIEDALRALQESGAGRADGSAACTPRCDRVFPANPEFSAGSLTAYADHMKFRRWKGMPLRIRLRPSR
jgi:hypothetical protein